MKKSFHSHRLTTVQTTILRLETLRHLLGGELSSRLEYSETSHR